MVSFKITPRNHTEWMRKVKLKISTYGLSPRIRSTFSGMTIDLTWYILGCSMLGFHKYYRYAQHLTSPWNDAPMFKCVFHGIHERRQLWYEERRNTVGSDIDLDPSKRSNQVFSMTMSIFCTVWSIVADVVLLETCFYSIFLSHNAKPFWISV